MSIISYNDTEKTTTIVSVNRKSIRAQNKGAYIRGKAT